jgi:hypothetical protein
VVTHTGPKGNPKGDPCAAQVAPGGPMMDPKSKIGDVRVPPPIKAGGTNVKPPFLP